MPRSPVNYEALQQRLDRLERKVDTLNWLAGTQVVLLAIIASVFLLRLTSYLAMALLIVIPVLIVFRRRVPGWLRRLGQLWAMISRRREPIQSPSSQPKSSM